MWYDHSEARREMFEDVEDTEFFGANRRQLLDDAQRDADIADMEDIDAVTGYEEHVRNEASHYDYVSEAYGDPCPGCRRLRYGGNCGNCMKDED